jgi:hypothetical protein
MPGGAKAPAATKPVAAPAARPTVPGGAGGAVATAAKPVNKNLFIIIGAGAAALILVIVLVIVLVGNSGGDDDYSGDYTSSFSDLAPGESMVVGDMGGAADGFYHFYDDGMGLAFDYPNYWTATFVKAEPDAVNGFAHDAVLLQPEGSQVFLVLCDYTDTYNSYINDGGTDGYELLNGLVIETASALGYDTGLFIDYTELGVSNNPDGSVGYAANWYYDDTYSVLGWAAMDAHEDIGRANGVFLYCPAEENEAYAADLSAITATVHSYANG